MQNEHFRGKKQKNIIILHKNCGKYVIMLLRCENVASYMFCRRVQYGPAFQILFKRERYMTGGMQGRQKRGAVFSSRPDEGTAGAVPLFKFPWIKQSSFNPGPCALRPGTGLQQ